MTLRSVPAQSCVAAFEARGATTATVLDLFDRLPAVAVSDMIGLWRGGGLHTGHPLDGILEGYGWYGKAFESPDRVHPLLMQDARGHVFPIDPARLPLEIVLRGPSVARIGAARAAFRMALPLLKTGKPKASVRPQLHRGVETATMVYKDLPIADSFRAVDRDTVLGLMDWSRLPGQPFFFVLRRAPQVEAQIRCPGQLSARDSGQALL